MSGESQTTKTDLKGLVQEDCCNRYLLALVDGAAEALVSSQREALS